MVKQMISLNNKNAFITGATGGIGWEITKQLAQKGCNLFLTSTNEKHLEASKEILSWTNRQIEYSPSNLNRELQVYKVISEAKKIMKHIDILINCAAIYLNKPITKCYTEEFDKIFNINVKAPWIFCKEFSREMIEKKWGRIVNFGSIASYHGHNNSSLYDATKHAILGLSRALFKELKDYNIRVYCASPGGTKTNMGKQCSNKKQYDTFLDPKDVAEYVVDTISYDSNMISKEIRMNRYFE